MASEELYFRRADLFTDKSEGLPPEQYLMSVLGLNPYDVNHRAELNNHFGSLAQSRETYFIICWHLFRQEELAMWEQYGHDGVAIISTYGYEFKSVNPRNKPCTSRNVSFAHG
jgi:hypothetical protein